MAISTALPRPGVHPWPMDMIPDPEVPERPGQVPARGVTADPRHHHDGPDQLAMSSPGGTSSVDLGESMRAIDSALK